MRLRWEDKDGAGTTDVGSNPNALANLAVLRSVLLGLLPDHFPGLSYPHIDENYDFLAAGKVRCMLPGVFKLSRIAAMEFPFYLRLFGHPFHPHLVFETLAYALGARLYFWLRRRDPEPPLSAENNLWLLIGCIFGAWVGSKLLAWAEMPGYYGPLLTHPEVLLGGKTIVGGLLGGWIGVEGIKKWRGITRSTGDVFVLPLAIGTAMGRIGCFLTGLSDHTYGVATNLPWGVDFGEGIRRHPTQLYECFFVLGLAFVAVLLRRGYRDRPGRLFRFYLAAYLGFRLVIEFIKPREVLWLNLSAIQLASAVGLVFSLISLGRLSKPDRAPSSLLTHG